MSFNPYISTQIPKNAFTSGTIDNSNDNGHSSASDTLANITRQDWQYYQSNYQPIEHQLSSYLGNYDINRQSAVDRSMATVQGQLQQQDSEFKRYSQGLGLQLTPGQQKSYQRSADLNAALAIVNSANQTGRNMDETKYNLTSGGLTTGQNIISGSKN